MTISVRSIAFFSSFERMRAAKWALFAGIVAAIAAVPHPADASRARIAGAYDGIWSVSFVTQRGNCSSNSVPFSVSGNRVSSAGGGRVSGGIGRGGSVSVAISVGASHASGSGRLAGNSGAGRWSGIITGDQCSGTWQAARS